MNIGTTTSAPTLNHHHQIAIPIAPPPVPPPPNFPPSELLEEDYWICVAFQRTSFKRDWEAAEAILHQKPELIRSAINQDFDTPLHFAIDFGITNSGEKFVENLVNLMDEEDLELQNKSYKTALSLAAAYGTVEMAKIIWKKNKYLLEIPDSEGMMPLHEAAKYANTDMVRYLYDRSNRMNTDSWTPENQGWVLQRCVKAYHFDVAVQIMKDHPELTSNKRLLGDVLLVLARNTDALKGKEPSTILRIIKRILAVFHLKLGDAEGESDALKLFRMVLKKIAKMPKNEIDDILQGPPLEIGEGQNKKTKYPSRLLFAAVKNGNTRFIIEFIQLHEDLILKADDKGCSIFHVAVKHRATEIYNLLYEIGWMKEIITRMEDVEGNNLLHLVAKSSKRIRAAFLPGIALGIQHELAWFKEVNQMIPSAYRQMKNKQGETPQDLFTKKHRHLVIEGEKWVNDTTTAFIVIPILFAYAAAFTLWGACKRNRNTGIPMFNQNPALIVFVIADAISLIFSLTSALIFLSIRTTRFVEVQLVESLAKKQMFGFATLILSVLTMLIAVSAHFFSLYNEIQKWIPIMFAGFSGIIILYAFQEFRPLRDVFYVTYVSRYLFQSKKRMPYLKSL